MAGAETKATVRQADKYKKKIQKAENKRNGAARRGIAASGIWTELHLPWHGMCK